MKRTVLLLVLLSAGCDRLGELRLPSLQPPGRQPPAEQTATAMAPPPPVGARTADEFDTTTAAQRAAATDVAPAAEEPLGEVVVSLGSPARAGLWLESGLVDAPRSGRVVAPDGTEAIVELRPATGGARLSLAAMRLLGLPLTDLSTLTVYGR